MTTFLVIAFVALIALLLAIAGVSTWAFFNIDKFTIG